MRTLLSLTLLAALAAADGSVDRIFQVWDTNKDGVLTPDELPDKGMFVRVDADKDGKVTAKEVATFLAGAKSKDADKKKPTTGKPSPKPEPKKSEAKPIPDPRTISERVADFFRRFDLNKDRKIQRKEFQGDDTAFKDTDRNRNKTLSVKEVARYITRQIREAKKRPNRNNFFDLFDRNRDRKVTRKEYDGPAKFFKDHDHDKNNVVTEKELNLGPQGGMEMKGDKDFMADGPTPLPKTGLLARYDKNDDGKITIEELKGAESVLRRLDKNGDGVLSGSEVR